MSDIAVTVTDENILLTVTETAGITVTVEDPDPITVVTVSVSPVAEAPIDGQQYARKDGAWVEVVGGTGNTYFPGGWQ